MRKFTKKMALAFGALLITAGFNTTKAQAGAALNFNAAGPADKVSLPQAISTNSLVGGTKITVEAWVRPTTLAGLGVIVGNYSNPNNSLQFLLRRDNSGYSFGVGNGTSLYNALVTPAGTSTINIWQHVAGVYDGTVISVYINGVFTSSVNSSSNYTFATTSNSITLGTNGINESFTGDIDEVRIWNTNRSRCEINTFMNCEIPTNAANLIANYHFNQGTAAAANATVTALSDATSNAFDGTLNNFALNGTTGNWITPGGVVSGFTTALVQPMLAISPSTNILTCLNNTVMLTASGASTYTWSGGVTNAVAFTASATTAYTVNATAVTGCTAIPAVASITTTSCPGEALRFDGVDDIVQTGVGITNALGTSSVLTAEAWIRPNTLAGNGSIVSNHNLNSSFCLRRIGNTYNAFVGFGTYNANSAVNTVTLNTWQHVAMVFDGTSLKLYINGNLAGNTTFPLYTLPANSIGNATVEVGNNGFLEAFNGDIDEVRIWKAARTQCEINTFKNCEIPTNATNLLANYHFNQGQAFSANITNTTLVDATSSAFTGTLTNMALTAANVTSNWVAPGAVAAGFTTTLAPPTVTINANPSLSTCLNNTISLTGSGASTYTWSGGVTNAVAFTASATTVYTLNFTAATGCTNSSIASVTANSCPGEALSFDGSSDIVNTGSALTTSLTNSTKLTVEAWVKPNTTSGLGTIVGNYNTTSSGALQFLLRRDNSMYTFWVGNGATWNNVGSVAAPTLNVWQHIAGVWDGTVSTIYINGVASSSFATTISNLGNASNNIVSMGGHALGGEYFQGAIDEVRVWNVARTKCEINTFKNCEIPADAAGLLANYHLNHGTAFANNTTVTIANDATSNANNGTLSTFALTAGNINSNWVAPGSVPAGYTAAIAAPGFTNSALAFCSGGTVSIGSTNATSYTWTPSLTNNTPFSPATSTTYSYAGTNSVTTCFVNSVANVTVYPSPAVTAVSSETNVICEGQSATLTANGATSYTWNTTATTAVIAISPSVTTTYTVTGSNANGCTNVATVTQSVSACTGIANNSNAASLEISPNPSSGLFMIKANTQVSIAVFDVLGSLIMKTEIPAGDYKLNLEGQSKGLYIVKCTSQGQVKSYRLIKD